MGPFVRLSQCLLAPCALTLCLALAGPALAEIVVISKPSVQMRTKPDDKAKPIAIVFGNDHYDVLDESEAWVKIRAAAKGGNTVTGWVPRDAVYPIIEPIAKKSLAYALELKNAGKEQEARAKLFEVMTRFRGTMQSYEAARALQAYHTGQPPLPEVTNGVADAKVRRDAERIGSWLLIEEGRLFIREKRYGEAVSLFEEARAWGKLNRSAMDGIREALQTQYKDRKDRDGALLALKAYFPNATDPVNFTIAPFALPQTTPPSMAPLAEPGPPIEEQDDTSGLHDFERKELELAPQDGGNGAPMPEQEKSNEPPAPEGDSNARLEQAEPVIPAPNAPAASMPAASAPGTEMPPAVAMPPAVETLPAVKEPQMQAPAAQTPAAQTPKAKTPELNAPSTPPAAPRRQPVQRRAVRKPPAQAAAKAPADSLAVNTDPARTIATTPSTTHNAPQSLPPGFATGDGAGVVAANPAPSQGGPQPPPPLPGMRPLKRGLWPEDTQAARTERPTPPPLLSELAERPPSAAK